MSLRRSLVVTSCLCLALSLAAGCATPRPKPKTVGQVVGEGVDTAVSWAGDALGPLLRRR